MKERVIFGATSNVGTAVARAWAAKKDRITIVGRSGEKLAILAKDLQARGAESVEICIMDFSNLPRLWDEVMELFRDKQRVDTLLVCQGVYYTGLEMNPELKKIQNLWEVNFQSVVTILMAAKSHFVRNGAGTMAAISGVVGERGRSTNYVYASSKAALNCFMSGFRQEVAPFGVRACTIVPGLVETNLTKDWHREGKLWSKLELTALDIVSGIEKQNVLYTPKYWGFLNYLLRVLPESLFYRLKIW